MMLTFLEHLPAPVLEVIAATLLIIVTDSVIVIFVVLLSETACRRIIRLVNAIAQLNNKAIRAGRHKRN
jgi:hypothetical protein